jgi:DNA mismatch repair protein MutS
MCFADVSTGTAHTTCLEGEGLAAQIISELCRYSPSEVLFNEAMLSCKEVTQYIKQQLVCAVELMDNGTYEEALCTAQMEQQFGPDNKTVTGLDATAPAFYALAALLFYLRRTQKKGVERLKTVHNYAEAQYMQLSPVTRANLELTQTLRGREKKGTLLWVLDQTQTAMGKRLIRTWIEQPLVNAAAINSRLDGVEELVRDSVKRADICDTLTHIFDMERLMTRTVFGSATPREMQALAATCEQIPMLRTLCGGFVSDEMTRVVQQMDELTDVKERIQRTLNDEVPAQFKDGDIIRPGFHAEIDELRDIVHGGKGYLASLETTLKEQTGIRTLKVGYNRVFGYYIEVSRSFTEQVPDYFIRKQTLVNAERYITQDLKDLENKILGANDRLAALERQLFDELLTEMSSHLQRIQRTAAAVAHLDVLAALADVAVQNDYVKPVVDNSDVLDIKEGRHPVVEQMLKGSLFVPNDTTLDCEENRMLIITGPNMAGKSTYMRQTALIALMAQIGSFVPARSCRMGIVDAIFTRVGASDDLSAGQSTFMVEMTEVAQILQQATPKSLVVLDEIGRGTSTFDGMSIARAVVEHMADKGGHLGCKTLFATHYHELTDLESDLDGVKNYNIAVKKRGDDITFLRRIVRGPADDSYGIQVARLAGLPDTVTKRAKEVLKVLEANAPGRSRTAQMDFDAYEAIVTPAVPSELVERLQEVDIETLTPLEALNFLYELKRTLAEQ